VIVLLTFIALELFASIVSAFYSELIDINIDAAAGIAGMLIQLIVGFVFLVYGSKILRIIRKGATLMKHQTVVNNTRLRRMTKRIMGSGVGMLIFVVCAALLGSPIFFTPYGFFFSITGLYFGLQITSIFQIFSFAKREGAKKSSVLPLTQHRSVVQADKHAVPNVLLHPKVSSDSD